MENINDITEGLKHTLVTRFNAKPASGGREYVMNCKYCPDTSRHMYISMPTEDKPPMFHCFKCEISGIVTGSKLLEWGVDNPELMIAISKSNKYIMSLPQNRKFKDRDVYYLKNDIITDSDLSRAKLNYINRRIGYDLTYQDLLDNKVVLNLYDLIKSNNITKLTRYPSICDELNESFIGFITVDNAYINMRNLREGKLNNKYVDKRYVNYNIFEKFDNTERFYVSPVNIDMRNPERIKLRLCEGAFDLLSIKYNLVKEYENNIYASILGSSYYAMVRYFMVKLGIINIELHIYKDNDILTSYFNDLVSILYPYNIPIYIHSNKKKGLDIFGKPIKDFGVSLDMIEEEIIRLN